MNENPRLFASYRVEASLPMSPSPLMALYGGAIDTPCLRLIADEWDGRTKEPTTIKIYKGFRGNLNVSRFARGFDIKDKPKFRQATVIDLLALGAHDKKLGLRNFVYGLGSAKVDQNNGPSSEVFDPTIFYPGLESMDGSRQMIARMVNLSIFHDTLIALVEL